jgi:predicted 3-demethylubiquinone-9 3-methyltransferase (glyoxalase superfamily)
MKKVTRIIPCIWFNTEAKQAVDLYTSIFENSKILSTSYYTEEGKEQHQRPVGSVLTIEFEIDGQRMTALNGGPQFPHSEAISFGIQCESQKEIDHFWYSLSGDGGEESMCGWLKDKFGVSWQVYPAKLKEWITDKDPAKVQRVFHAFMQMKKFDLEKLEAAYKG